MALADDVIEAVSLLSKGGLETRAGVVVTSPSQISTDPLTVQLDGSSVAVEVKQFRGFPVFPGMRVGLVKIEDDWVVIGAFTNPGAGTNTMRMAVGADTPAELKLYGVEVAFLFYVTDSVTGLEVGYFFIGLSNVLDLPPVQKVLLFGHCKYPTPGDPTSPTSSSVDTNFQINLENGSGTWFKDASVFVQDNVPQWVFDNPVTAINGSDLWVGASDSHFVGDNVWFGQSPAEQAIVLDDKAVLWLHGKIVTTNESTIEPDGFVPTVAINSVANILVPGATTTITKSLAGTRMRLTAHGMGWATGTAGFGMFYGVRISRASPAFSFDYDIGHYYFNTLSDHRSFSSFRTYDPIPVGTYTMQLYCRVGTAGRNVNLAAEDWWSVRYEEIH